MDFIRNLVIISSIGVSVGLFGLIVCLFLSKKQQTPDEYDYGLHEHLTNEDQTAGVATKEEIQGYSEF